VLKPGRVPAEEVGDLVESAEGGERS